MWQCSHREAGVNNADLAAFIAHHLVGGLDAETFVLIEGCYAPCLHDALLKDEPVHFSHDGFYPKLGLSPASTWTLLTRAIRRIFVSDISLCECSPVDNSD